MLLFFNFFSALLLFLFAFLFSFGYLVAFSFERQTDTYDKKIEYDRIQPK